MSTTPESAADEIVSLLSHWLARHVSNEQLRDRIAAIGTGALSEESAQAVEELLAELRDSAPGQRGSVERVVRETLEAVALSG